MVTKLQTKLYYILLWDKCYGMSLNCVTLVHTRTRLNSTAWNWQINERTSDDKVGRAVGQFPLIHRLRFIVRRCMLRIFWMKLFIHILRWHWIQIEFPQVVTTIIRIISDMQMICNLATIHILYAIHTHFSVPLLLHLAAGLHILITFEYINDVMIITM